MSRTIIVGDVHGCLDELQHLLEQVRWRAHEDKLYFVGDLASRGPSPLGVLQFVRRAGARPVLGNHENALLRWRSASSQRDGHPKLGRSQRALAEQMQESDWALIESLPLYLELPEHDLRIVHAGVLPDIAMEAQPRDVLLNIRYVDRAGHPLDTREPPSGAALWGERYQGTRHIVFGHYARLSVQIHPQATGIDTGAVYGNRLTAIILEPGQKMPPPHERETVLASVASAQSYYAPRKH